LAREIRTVPRLLRLCLYLVILSAVLWGEKPVLSRAEGILRFLSDGPALSVQKIGIPVSSGIAKLAKG